MDINNQNNDDLIRQQERAARFRSYKVGGKDENDFIVNAIYARGEEYVIYEIVTNDPFDSLKIDLDSACDGDPNNTEANFKEISSTYAQAKGLLHMVADKPYFKNMIAHALAQAIDGDPAGASSQLEKTMTTIKQVYEENQRNKLKFILTTLTLAIGACVIAVLVYYNHLFIQYPHIRYGLFVAAAGSVSGFLSVALRLTNKPLEYEVPKSTYYWYSIERIMISIFAAVIVYFAIRSELLFALPERIEKPIYGYIIFAFVAGFSETLIPNLLVKLENSK